MSETEKRKRDDYRRCRKRWICVLAVLVALCAVASIALFAVYHRLNTTYYIDYTENGSVDYKVNLKPNDFYEGTQLGSGQAYVASLIDGVVADFRYDLAMESGSVNYEYAYRVDTQLFVLDDRNGEELWAPIVVNKPEQKFTQSSSSLHIREQLSVDYEYYNDLAKTFIETYELSNATAKLVVRMHVSVISTCEEFENNAQNEYVVALNMPLVAKTLHIEMETAVPAAESKILACDRNDNKNVFLYAAFGTAGGDLLLLLALVLVIYLTRNTDINYAIKVKRILSAYRSYIQKINNEFDTAAYQVLRVDTFNEMLDIRDTIQSPILMHENEDMTCTRFLIPTATNLLYLFEVKVDNYDEIYRLDEPATEPVAEIVAEPEIIETPAKEPALQEEAIAAALIEEPVLPIPADEPAVQEDASKDGALDFGGKYDYSFEAKLAFSEQEVREYYRSVVEFVQAWGVKVSRSWKRERIYLGRNLFALLTFKGRKLAIALALDPATHADPKYHAMDMSAVRKYERTPMLMRITSKRKVKYATELLAQLFEAAGVPNGQRAVQIDAIPYRTRKELVLAGLIKTQLHPDEIVDEPMPAAVEPAEEIVPEIVEEIAPVQETTDVARSFDFGPKTRYSFEAKLALSPKELRGFYREVSDFARSYGVKVVRNWQYERIYLGRKLFAVLTFKGKKLAIALALDPATHADPKYHSIDMSNVRKYQRTPMLMRITSARKVKYAIELLTQLFAEAGLEHKNLTVKPVATPQKSKKALMESNLIRFEGEK